MITKEGMFIYHVMLPEIWEAAKDQTFYSAPSLDEEGFIHCSYDHQLEGVIGRYYRDRPRLVIVELDVAKLTSKLVSEPSTGGEVYPHVYGPLDLAAVHRVEIRETNPLS